MTLQVLTNPSFQISHNPKSLADLEVMAQRQDVVTRESVTIVQGSPAVKVLLSKVGIEIVLSWFDRSKTILHVDVPLRSSASFPMFQDYSGGRGPDTLIKFTSESADVQAENLKAGRAALILRVQLFIADGSTEPIEYFSITRKGSTILLAHKNVSAVLAPAPKPPAEPESESIEDLELPELPQKSSSDDSDSWDIDELLKDD